MDYSLLLLLVFSARIIMYVFFFSAAENNLQKRPGHFCENCQEHVELGCQKMISMGFHSAILSCEDMQLLFTSSCFTCLSCQKEHSIFVKPCWEQFKLGFQKIISLGLQCCLVQIMSCMCSYFSLFHVLLAFSLCWNAKPIVFCTLLAKRPL